MARNHPKAHVAQLAGWLAVAFTLTGCATGSQQRQPISVAETPTSAQAPDGQYIHWREHQVDDELLTGAPIRGGDGLLLADIDRDGHLDIVSVHEDSHHLRIAFGSADPDRWVHATVASGAAVGAIEDVAVGDIDGDGWPDLAAACEDAHLAVFRNPGAGARKGNWPHLVIAASSGRGSWLQVALVDMDGDGRPELLGANKGTADVVRWPAGERPALPNSLFRLQGDMLSDAAWQEQVLQLAGVPNQMLPVDIDNDGDLDLLTAQRLANTMTLLLNDGPAADGSLQVRVQPIRIQAGFATVKGWRGVSNAFNAVFADMDGDGRKDLITNVLEFDTPSSRAWSHAGLGWLQQPADLTQPWLYQRIGNTLPDWVIGIGVADLDGDGDLDAVTGGYSGLNVVRGGYSGHSRDLDDPRVTNASSVARISWFQNPGAASGAWARHDISRRVRGMYDDFVAHDVDRDGDLDLVATRGNSGVFDGVFWLEQQRSPTPQPAMTSTRSADNRRSADSRSLPLPPQDWRTQYDAEVEYVAPNKAAQDEALRRASNAH